MSVLLMTNQQKHSQSTPPTNPELIPNHSWINPQFPNHSWITPPSIFNVLPNHSKHFQTRSIKQKLWIRKWLKKIGSEAARKSISKRSVLTNENMFQRPCTMNDVHVMYIAHNKKVEYTLQIYWKGKTLI